MMGVAFAPLIAFPRPSAGPDKAAFHRYLMDFDAAQEEAVLLEKFRECDDVLPAQYAELLFLPAGSTYRDAVKLLLSHWNGPFSGACDWHDEDVEDPDR